MKKRMVVLFSVLAVSVITALSIRACGVVDTFKDFGEEMSQRVKGVGKEAAELRDNVEKIRRSHEVNWYISGYVYDMETHRPVANAAASVYGRGIETNEDGFFELQGDNWQEGYVEWIEVKNRSLCRIEKELSYNLDRLQFTGRFTIYLCNDQQDSTLEQIYNRFKTKYETYLTPKIRSEIEKIVDQKWVEGTYTVMVRLWDIRSGRQLITGANLGVSGTGSYHHYPWSDLHFTYVDGLALINGHLFQDRVDLLQIVDGLEYVNFDVTANETEATVNLYFRSAAKPPVQVEDAPVIQKSQTTAANASSSTSGASPSSGSSGGGCSVSSQASGTPFGMLLLIVALFLIGIYRKRPT